MIQQHTLSIANYLLAALPWLRDISVLTRKYEGAVRKSSFEGDANLGVDDRRGNHAYIRYTGSSQDITYGAPSRPINSRARVAASDLTMVCVFQLDDPEAVAAGLAMLLASCPLPAGSNIELLSADADRYDILTDELGTDSENWKAARIRFNLTWNQNFAVCPTPTPLNFMDRCCLQKIDLGCVNSCEDIDTGFDKPAGNYTIEYMFEGAARLLTITHTLGNLIIPTTGLNESYVYTVRIYSGDDQDAINFTRDGVTTKCLSFKIYPTV